MNYQESIDYIDKLYIGKVKESTLSRMEKVFRVRKVLDLFLFDDPKVIHVAGTNGKGSTCSMIANILFKSGYKVGLYTSPHLVKINERIKINNIDISDDDFAKYVTKVVDVIEKNNIELLFFEILTIVALLYFKDAKCDIVVLETGLGGEYDATNVIKNPLCTVITNIGLDHEDILGVGIENIAKAKAGIIKENVDCVVYDIKDGKDVIGKVAKEKCAKLHFVDFNNIIYKSDTNNIIFNYKTYSDLSTSLLGNHQVYNACVAIETIDLLKTKGFTINNNAIKDGLKNVDWPARFQILQEKNPKVILDGGHNPQCIDAIVTELKKYRNDNMVFVVCIVKDKNADLMAKKLSSISKRFVLTHIDNKRSMEENEIKNVFLRYSDDVTYKYDIKESVECAKIMAGSEGIVCIIGSLYFAGELLKIYK